MTIFRFKTIGSLGVALALAGCGQQPATPDNSSVVANAVLPASGATSAPAALHALPEQVQIARAFLAVFGKPAPLSALVDGSTEKTTPAKLMWRGDRALLITTTAVDQGCHACSGSLGVYYLKADGDRFAVTGKFPHAVEGQGFGAPPSGWSISEKFGPSPVLYSETGSTGQGYTCSAFDLTELGGDRPIKLVTVPIHYDNGGEESGGAVGGEPAEAIDGKIAAIVPGKSFTVHYSGSAVFDETYFRAPRSFALTGQTKMKTC